MQYDSLRKLLYANGFDCTGPPDGSAYSDDEESHHGAHAMEPNCMIVRCIANYGMRIGQVYGV